jgi:hypothetical protein
MGDAVLGSPEQCRQQLLMLQRAYDTREIVFADLAQRLATRLESCRLIAAACDIPRRKTVCESHETVAA